MKKFLILGACLAGFVFTGCGESEETRANIKRQTELMEKQVEADRRKEASAGDQRRPGNPPDSTGKYPQALHARAGNIVLQRESGRERQKVTVSCFLLSGRGTSRPGGSGRIGRSGSGVQRL